MIHEEGTIAIERFTRDEVLPRLEEYADRELTPHEVQLVRERLEATAARPAE